MGHVYDEFQSFFFRGLGKNYRGLNLSVRQRIDEIGTPDTLQRSPDVPNHQHVAKDNVGAKRLKCSGAHILFARQCSYSVTSL
ncbi:hypothetical protein GRAN_3597 [Granulicella sibirica]|uniref:Uncharacterized protein n=1 Tax=Granulicella sibirica TaxID=2479048 RepID=A0A4V1L546_9BACT|nr:hypothetical protein GRAN_3597 [Granulicella sibirica]